MDSVGSSVMNRRFGIGREGGIGGRSAQRGFALSVDLSLHVIRNVLQNFDVRRDALGLNRAPRRCVVPSRSQPQRAIAAAERNDRLYRSFAERAGADESGALLVLQRAGD